MHVGMKQPLSFAFDPELRTEGRFVFALDDPPLRPFLVRVDGRIVAPRHDGAYELDARPKHGEGSIVVEVCAGPFYAMQRITAPRRS